MKYILSILLLLSFFTGFSQTVPQRNNVPWYEYTRKLSIGQRFAPPTDTLSYPPGAINRDTTGLLAFAPNGNLYKLWNGAWERVGGDSSTFVQVLGDTAIVVNDDTLIIKPKALEVDLAPEYAIEDGDTIRLFIRQYIQDSVLITKSGDTLFFPNGDTLINGQADTLTGIRRINVGPVEDSLHTRRGQLQILGNSTSYPNGVVSLYRIQNSPPNPATYQGTTVVGSLTSPVALKHNEFFGMISFEGTDGTTSSGTAAIREGFRMRSAAVGNWSSSNWGTNVKFEMYPKDSISQRRIFAQFGDTSYLRPTSYLWLTRGSNLGIAGSTALFQTDGRMHTTKHLIEGNLRSSATSLTIVDSTYYIFTGGSDATWTLPAVGTPGRRIFIKNAGSAVLTVQRAGSDQIFTNTLVNSFALLTGADRVLVDDGVYWQTFSN